MSEEQLQIMRERGERLRQAAQTIGITNAAKAAGVPYTTLRDYMNGQEMKLSAVAALARACGVSLDWITFGTGEAPTQPESPVPNATQSSDTPQARANAATAESFISCPFI